MAWNFVLLACMQRCGSASLVIPVGLALPYLWRFVQCIRVYLDTGARPQIWNAVKYSTAFPVSREGRCSKETSLPWALEEV